MLVFAFAALMSSPAALSQTFYTHVDLKAASKDLDFIKTPEARPYLEDKIPKVDASGRMGGNAEYAQVHAQGVEPDTCFIKAEVQRGVWNLIALGALEHDLDKIRSGLSGIEWTLGRVCYDNSLAYPANLNPWMGQEGSESGKRGIKQNEETVHNKHMFLQAATRSLRLLKAYRYVGENSNAVNKEIKDRVNALIPDLFKVTYNLAIQPYVDEKFIKAMIQQKKAANQVLIPVVSDQEAAMLVHDLSAAGSTERENARKLMEKAYTNLVAIVGQDNIPVTALMQQDGTLPEGKPSHGSSYGFDSTYQTFSVELLARYEATLLPSSVVSQNLRKKIILATNRFLDKVWMIDGDDYGKIDVCANSRTTTLPAGSAELNIPWRLSYLEYLYGPRTYKGSSLVDYREAIIGAGEGFEHITPNLPLPASCSGN